VASEALKRAEHELARSNFSDKEMNEFVKDFKAKTRFHLDEPVSPVVGEALGGGATR